MVSVCQLVGLRHGKARSQRAAHPLSSHWQGHPPTPTPAESAPASFHLNSSDWRASGRTSALSAKLAKSSNMAGRGSKPGERRGGRQKGVPNKSTGSLRDLAREYAQSALGTLAEVMTSEDSPAAARVAAASALLDRGYGKPSQVLTGDEDGGPVVHQIELVALESDDSSPA